ncbi:hypothetical protein [Zooshikella ganghwensis]|uniref:hypothetical protein n=1 Tax=Zooshikella ganghwensis TaxID=202772 RepID=UPI00048A27D6|nr:hypothetical protein [Zooshikella ganghwensis]
MKYSNDVLINGETFQERAKRVESLPLGSKESKGELKKFHSCLNQTNLVPDQCYKMSHRDYPMVCYTNQIIALYLSNNYDVIPLFISRVLSQLERNKDQPNTEKYRSVVYDYLCMMAYFLLNFCTVDKDTIDAFIPKKVQKAGPRLSPLIDNNTQEISFKEN